MTETATEQRTFGEDLAADLRRLADLAADSEAIAEELRYTFCRLLVSLTDDDPKAVLATFVRNGVDIGASIRKVYDEEWGGADITFPHGALMLHVYAARSKVCTRRVVGTREVTVEEPDPVAVAALPKVKRTKTVDVVEWDCTPLLAAVTE